jgi:fused signal recognition particle receptor
LISFNGKEMFNFLKSGYQKVKKALTKTSSLLGGRLRALFGKPWSEETFDQLEQILYEADLGTQVATDFVEHLRKFLRNTPDAPLETIVSAMHQYSLEILKRPPRVLPKEAPPGEPLVILIVGVNGSGKTTSIAKLAKQFQAQGKTVLLAAGDTFRAAAIEQLETWAERLGIPCVKGKSGSDPSAIAFDALTAAKARGTDVVLIDTAGRLQNKTDLMHELEKIKRTCAKIIPTAPHETLLVLDATTGQNALDQAKTFNTFTPLTGIVLAKLDGSAKGGIVLAITDQLGIPVRWIGIGEGLDDFTEFDPDQYANALFDLD